MVLWAPGLTSGWAGDRSVSACKKLRGAPLASAINFPLVRLFPVSIIARLRVGK
jgi:hypothetical protein